MERTSLAARDLLDEARHQQRRARQPIPDGPPGVQVLGSVPVTATARVLYLLDGEQPQVWHATVRHDRQDPQRWVADLTAVTPTRILAAAVSGVGITTASEPQDAQEDRAVAWTLSRDDIVQVEIGDAPLVRGPDRDTSTVWGRLCWTFHPCSGPARTIVGCAPDRRTVDGADLDRLAAELQQHRATPGR